MPAVSEKRGAAIGCADRAAIGGEPFIATTPPHHHQPMRSRRATQGHECHHGRGQLRQQLAQPIEQARMHRESGCGRSSMNDARMRHRCARSQALLLRERTQRRIVYSVGRYLTAPARPPPSCEYARSGLRLGPSGRARFLPGTHFEAQPSRADDAIAPLGAHEQAAARIGQGYRRHFVCRVEIETPRGGSVPGQHAQQRVFRSRIIQHAQHRRMRSKATPS